MKTTLVFYDFLTFKAGSRWHPNISPKDHLRHYSIHLENSSGYSTEALAVLGYVISSLRIDVCVGRGLVWVCVWREGYHVHPFREGWKGLWACSNRCLLVSGWSRVSPSLGAVCTPRLTLSVLLAQSHLSIHCWSPSFPYLLSSPPFCSPSLSRSKPRGQKLGEEEL